MGGTAYFTFACFKNNPVIRAMTLSINLKSQGEITRFLWQFFHGVLGSSATQFSSLLDTTIASF